MTGKPHRSPTAIFVANLVEIGFETLVLARLVLGVPHLIEGFFETLVNGATLP